MDRSHPCQHGIYRTENLVRPTYWGDGHGRDTYVLSNGSGLRNDPDMWGSGRKPGWDICVQKGSHNKMYAGLRPGKPAFNQPPTSAIQYVSDGSGRDTYVIKNHGGTCNEYRIGHVKYPTEYLRNTKKYPYETPIMDSRMQNKNISNVTYTNWPSMQAIKDNMKNFEVQRSSINRLSPEPGSKINTDPVALEVHKNRVLEKAKSQIKNGGSGRAQTALGNSRAQNMRFAYLKKGAGMGQNFIERDAAAAGLFTREQMTINGTGPSERRNELARAQTNAGSRMDQKNLFSIKDVDVDNLIQPQAVVAKTLESSGYKPTQNQFNPSNAFLGAYNLDGDIHAEDLRSKPYQTQNYIQTGMHKRKQSYQQQGNVDIGQLIQRNFGNRSMSVSGAGSKSEQKRFKQSKQTSAQFAKQFMAEARQFLQSERPTRKNSVIAESGIQDYMPSDQVKEMQRLKTLRQQSLVLNHKLKKSSKSKHQRANTVLTQMDAPRSSFSNTLLKKQKQAKDIDDNLDVSFSNDNDRYNTNYNSDKKANITLNYYTTPNKKMSMTTSNTPGQNSGRNHFSIQKPNSVSNGQTTAESKAKVNGFNQLLRKSNNLSRSKQFRNSTDFNDH